MEVNMPRRKSNRGPPSTDIEKLPKSTPTIALLGETGCMRMKFKIHKRHLNYISREHAWG